MNKVRSADGTAIAYEQTGSGRPLILVGGALCVRASTRPLAEALAPDFTVVSYDRRGRGDSGDHERYAVAREVEDLGALITALGGTAAVYGHSSGAALVVEAAAAGLPITKAVLHEPPYGPDDPAAQAQADAAAREVLELLTANRRRDAVETFLQLAGMPAEDARALAADPALADVAHTLAYDFDVVGDGPVPAATVAKVTQPTLALCGSSSPEFMVETARVLAKTLPGGQYAELPGQHHVVAPEVLAPVVREFLRS